MKMIDHLLEYDIHDNVTAFTTTREGGCSIGAYSSFNANMYCGDDPAHVNENRNTLCDRLHIERNRLINPHQTHSTNILVINKEFLSLTENERQHLLEGVDALVSDERAAAICVSTADCVPVIVYDKFNHAAAAIHAGWRGTVNRIVEKTIEKMHEVYGTDGEDCMAIIGPSISIDNFEVGDEVYDAFKNAGFNMKAISRLQPAMNALDCQRTKWHIDLWECNKRQLMEKNIDAGNIFVTGICTYKNSEMFFSARKLGIQSGRLLTGIILR